MGLTALLLALAQADSTAVSVLDPPPVAGRTPVELSVTVVDPEFAPGLPLELRLSAAEVALTENRFDERDVVDPHAAQPRLRARVTAPSEPGRYLVHGVLRYVACHRTHCRSRRVELEWVVEVVVEAGA